MGTDASPSGLLDERMISDTCGPAHLHAGGIDRPLSIWKEGVGSVRPHQNWRGQFSRGR